MNFLPYRDILAALRLTRAGDLLQATALLQRTLGGAAAAHASRSDTNADRSSVTASGRNNVFAIDSANSAQTVERIAKADSLCRSSGGKNLAQSLHEKPRGEFPSLSFSNAAGIRTYKLYIPSDYHGQPCPLIVMLHACMQSPDDFAEGTRMNVLADQLTCFVAYPGQSASANSSKCWNCDPLRYSRR